ncbi:MAG: hypothetical protein KJZ74_03820 [Gemmatimonadales bacterium]|nr:hypothetical protein [Gemmatimonadales bacterium]
MFAALSNLVPNPLHPAVVHLPIALTVLVPAFAVGALVAIRRGARPVRAWGITTALLATLSLSAWVSLETGADQEDRVERVVTEQAIHSHEEAAEAFLALSLLVLVIAGAGLLNGRIGTGARLAATVGTLALIVAGYRVGHSGGALVYQHGAASAYTSSASIPLTGERNAGGDHER